MKKGVQAFTVRDFLTTPEQCRESFGKIAEMGYDSVQAWPTGGMTAQQMQDMLAELGLENCSGGGDFKEMAAGRGIAEAVAAARSFNTKYIGVDTLPEENRYTKDGLKRYADALNKIAAELKKEGCALLYHHHALEFYSLGDGVTGMDILTEETDPEGVYWTLDTHWLTSGGVDPVHWIKKLKGRVPIIHFKDYGIVEGAVGIEEVRKSFAEVGEGNINWPPIVAACKETGIEYVIVEQDICKGNPFDSLRTSYKNLCKFNV
ncbi:MAG: sugar phosphate isomerase/epimerase [Defluviitaleaceae bacterium]|nr:sugar phosphate isomerase/epimerase [Defluviitaleaceae bacterium]